MCYVLLAFLLSFSLGVAVNSYVVYMRMALSPPSAFDRMEWFIVSPFRIYAAELWLWISPFFCFEFVKWKLLFRY